MGHPPVVVPKPASATAEVPKGLFDAAIAKSGVPVDMLNFYLVGRGYVREGQGINEAPASIKAALVRDPETLGKVVSAWIDEHQQPDAQPELGDEQGQDAGDDQGQQQ
jgi:hypothetical protein